LHAAVVYVPRKRALGNETNSNPTTFSRYASTVILTLLVGRTDYARRVNDGGNRLADYVAVQFGREHGRPADNANDAIRIIGQMVVSEKRLSRNVFTVPSYIYIYIDTSRANLKRGKMSPYRSLYTIRLGLYRHTRRVQYYVRFYLSYDTIFNIPRKTAGAIIIYFVVRSRIFYHHPKRLRAV